MKILTGYQPPTSGRLFVDGREVALHSVDHARSLGIECVYQDLALANSLSVYHNMFLNREIVHRGPFRLLNNRAMRAAGGGMPGRDRACTFRLSICQWNGCPAASARRSRWRGRCNSEARILLLDEPLAAMGAREAGLIIDLLLRLKSEGRLSIAMIMHNYAQTLDIADRVMLMQHGRVTYEKAAAATSVAELMEIVRREYRAMRTG